MIHNHQQKTRFRSLTDDLCCIVVKEIKILFNLVKNLYYEFLNDNAMYEIAHPDCDCVSFEFIDVEGR